jgi:WD40 repeat protein
MGAAFEVGAHVEAIFFQGDQLLIVRGDGAVERRGADGAQHFLKEDVHAGAVLCAAAAGHGRVLTGGDDGRLLALNFDGETQELHRFKGAWVDAVAAHAGLIAAAVGKDAVILSADGVETARFAHEQRVTGVAFEASGRRIAASHYGGVTLSWASNPSSRRKTLNWTGAHLSVVWSPDARFVVTTMQENALHGWRLQDGGHFRMAGYPAKIKALSFAAGGKWLATAGAPEVVCWPFSGANGPMNQRAAVIGELGAPATQVACHPTKPIVAAGAADGEVALFRLDGQGKPLLIDPGAGAPVTALTWSADGRFLAYGGEAGRAGVLDFAEALAAS